MPHDVTPTTTHVFTDPVRYFKSNDPYYWEVDNIPLKQLQENCLYLKDALTPGISSTIHPNGIKGEVDRTDLGELRPHFLGNDRKLNVHPGRYMARVNDAYKKQRLQELRWIKDGSGKYISDALQTSGAISTILDGALKGTSVFNFNGLDDRIRVWAQLDPLNAQASIATSGSGRAGSSPPTSLGSSLYPKAWPLLFSVPFNDNFNLGGVISYINFNFIQELSMNLIRHWRGVARTAVVDIPNTLTVDIPDFDANDFFYIAEDGTKTYPTAPAFRIDMVFVYTKPVDDDSTTINTFDSGGNPTTITAPTLGIVKGAGLGANFSSGGSKRSLDVAGLDDDAPLQDTAGNTLMAANVKDADSTTNGFLAGPFTNSEVHGSFPSPEDLMNLSPNLMENLESTDLQLIGQSILPICYVLVPSTGTINAASQVVLTNANLLDIRPFLRTAELAFNERAGIAAAVPQLSFANPAVGEIQLKDEVQRVHDKLNADITTAITGDIATNPRSIAKGIIWGGLLYGPEGALFKLKQGTGDIASCFEGGVESGGPSEALKQIIGLEFADANCSMQIPVFPSWDFPKWAETKADRGKFAPDWIHERYMGAYKNTWTSASLGFYGITRDAVFGGSNSDIGFTHGGFGPGLRPLVIRYCRKEITITDIPDHIRDIQILTNYVNCLPISEEGGDDQSDAEDKQAFQHMRGVSTSKSQIFERQLNPNLSTNSRSCNIRITSYFPGVGMREGVGTAAVTSRRANPSDFLAHIAFSGDISPGDPDVGANVGLCMYPTVEFDIVGYPESSVNPDQNNYGISIANKTITELDPNNFSIAAENTQDIHSQLKAR